MNEISTIPVLLSKGICPRDDVFLSCIHCLNNSSNIVMYSHKFGRKSMLSGAKNDIQPIGTYT